MSLNSVLQSKIDLLLKEDKEWDEKLDDQRYEILEEIKNLPDSDRTQIDQYVLQWLQSMPHTHWQHAWGISTLSQLGYKDGQDYVKQHMLEQHEGYYWTRHFALINGANFDPFPEPEIRQAIGDRDVLPKATALRLLIAHGFPQYERDLQKMMLNQKNPAARWATARALRTRSKPSMKALPADTEKLFIPMLADIAGHKYAPLDARWESIQTLVSFAEKKMVAVRLSELLMKDSDATMRRYYLEALRQLDQPAEIKEALLKAVEDQDAQIRLDAAATLKTIDAVASTARLVELALKRENDTEQLVEALRHIDRELAAKELREALGSSDTQVSRRANQLLTDLGGQTAAQILLTERSKAVDRYTRILTGADYEVRQHFNQLMAQARSAFWISMAMHTVVFLIGVAALTGSLILALNGGSNAIVTWASGAIGVASLLITTFYQNPLRNVRSSLNSLMQVDVVFLGYVRQINQIDATFKHLFLETRDFGTPQMQATVAEIQSAVNKILEEIRTHILEKEASNNGSANNATAAAATANQGQPPSG